MIREARSEDLEGILDLLYQLSPLKEEDSRASKIKLKEILSDMLADENYLLCVYEDGQRLLGTAMLITQLNLSHGGRPYGHIENVVIEQNFRSNGIGRQMVDYLVKEADKRNCYKTVLSCEGKNIPFYEKCNFHLTGEAEMRRDK